MADEVKSQARDLGEEALERGKLGAQEAAGSTVETAKKEGQRQGEALKGITQEKALNLT